MNQNVSGFRELHISRPSAACEWGDRLASAFAYASLPIHWYSSDAEVVSGSGISGASVLSVIRTPLAGWISVAQHGTLNVRHREYYVHPIIGCKSACTYCYLQAKPRTRTPLRFHVDLDSLQTAIKDCVAANSSNGPLLLCTGELADSLADSDLFPVAHMLVQLVSQLEHAHLELRTKSDAVQSLPTQGHNSKTTVAFSLNPSVHVARYEPGTVSLEARLAAAQWCQDRGYPIALKLEPLLLTEDWRELWRITLKQTAASLIASQIEHVSVGCLRWSDELGSLNHFRRNHRELIEYPARIEYRPGCFNSTAPFVTRMEAYRWMREMLRDNGIFAPIWWSMEERSVVEELR